VLSGGILMLNGLCYAVEKRIEQHVPLIVSYFVSACTQKNFTDDMSVRMGCGLISDLASVADDTVSLEISSLIPALSTVLADNEIQTEAKFHAIVALGDVCLASEEKFFPFLPEVMKSFQLAS
jgi:starvation-inducible outer membrane lipoprotein